MGEGKTFHADFVDVGVSVDEVICKEQGEGFRRLGIVGMALCEDVNGVLHSVRRDNDSVVALRVRRVDVSFKQNLAGHTLAPSCDLKGGIYLDIVLLDNVLRRFFEHAQQADSGLSVPCRDHGEGRHGRNEAKMQFGAIYLEGRSGSEDWKPGFDQGCFTKDVRILLTSECLGIQMNLLFSKKTALT